MSGKSARGLKMTKFPISRKILETSDLTFYDPMDCSLPSSSVHGILQARIPGWVAMPSSWGSSQPKGGSPQCLHLLYLLHWQAGS